MDVHEEVSILSDANNIIHFIVKDMVEEQTIGF